MYHLLLVLAVGVLGHPFSQRRAVIERVAEYRIMVRLKEVWASMNRLERPRYI